MSPLLSRRLVDRYLLRLMLPRMGAALIVTLVALLLERMLRLFDLVTGQGATIGPALGMAISLVPHYIGLAMPAAFCIGVLTCLASLSQQNEIDALESAGWSLRRIGVPFILCALVLMLFSLALFGVIQPYSRYAYYEIRHSVLTSAWNGRIEQGVFVEAGEDLTLSAAAIDPTGRVLDRVFAIQKDVKGEVVLTARRGLVVPEDGGKTVRLLLSDGVAMTPDGGRLDFNELALERRFPADANPFRPRGDSERELTMAELFTLMRGEGVLPPDPRYAAEFHARLIRAVSLIGVALLAVPLGVARKRSPAWPRIAIAIGILAAYDNVIKMVESMADLGKIDPALGLWGLCAGFIALTGLVFLLTPGQGALSPVRSVLRLIDLVIGDVRRLLRRSGDTDESEDSAGARG
ncbi:LptF/LptG family permease [Limibaculum sp. M0105]|uniref:LptF/LptG family permease n=1 Tax=Thermohalobaculum xanthum TaxID=2753746 RepID=A0A8J7M9K3_9RHOB|nr:LptF/LptG family permease [Thermohalobaculum xanthum]MBK0400290.1 LptF/LptG family permease [Thermohalobaculum xanthum]